MHWFVSAHTHVEQLKFQGKENSKIDVSFGYMNILQHKHKTDKKQESQHFNNRMKKKNF
jgi:hypothetical protein